MSKLPPASQATSSPQAANDVTATPSPLQWADIVQQLGAEIAGPLSLALQRIQDLASTGQIDRRGLRALRQSVDEARSAGMLGQQLARLVSGRLRLARERLQLAQMLRSVTAQRSRETQARGVQVRQMLEPVEVWGDGALLFSLLNAMLDWALANTHSAVELRLSLTPWPIKARLSCRFAHRSMELFSPGEALEPAETLPDGLDSLAWRLVEQTAVTLGVLPLREQEAGMTLLTLEFSQVVVAEPPMSAPALAAADVELPPLTDNRALAPLSPTERAGVNSRPLAGCHLLIVSARRELRAEVSAAVQHMGLIVDGVASIEEAEQFCAEGLPHALVVDQALRGAALDKLLAGILRDAPDFSVIVLGSEDQPTRLSTATDDGMARIGRRHLLDALPGVLMFELSRSR